MTNLPAIIYEVNVLSVGSVVQTTDREEWLPGDLAITRMFNEDEGQVVLEWDSPNTYWKCITRKEGWYYFKKYLR